MNAFSCISCWDLILPRAEARMTSGGPLQSKLFCDAFVWANQWCSNGGDLCVYLSHLYTKHSDAKIYALRQKLKILFGHVVHIFKEDKQELVLTSKSEPAEAQAVLLHLLKGD